MTEKTLTTENIKPALDALRGELAPWPVVAKKQDRLNTAQLNAANSGITSSLVAQIIANTAAIRALESAITGTGLRALVVASLPAVGTTGILYIVPVTTYDPDTDADVVNYSSEYIWIPVEGGQASEGHYEQVGQTGIVINNGQLTITVNGTSVGTFTANQSGDTTAAITVPTNADYVDRTTDQTVAGDKTWTGEQSFTLPIVGSLAGTASKAIADEDGTSIKTGYVNVAGNQTVSGDKSFTGSNTFNNILPNATNTYSLGSSSYQWQSVYAQTYYYKGTAWGLDRANTWTESQAIKNTDYQIGEMPSAAKARYINFTDKNNVNIGWIQRRIESSGDSSIELFVYNRFTNSQPDPAGTQDYAMLKVGLKSDQTHFCEITGDTYPRNNNTYNLGTSTNKWKTLNGINPGALSLPDAGKSVNIDTTGWVTDGSAWNTITSSNLIDGYLYLNYSMCSADDYISVRLRTSSHQNPTFCVSVNTTRLGNHYLYVCVPVSKLFNVFLEIKTTGTLQKACIFPMLGNV